MTDEKYMELALRLAEKAAGWTSPNPMVGAVIVKDGEIIGTGYHRQAGTPHAEIHALREAGERARGATLYVNLEPCAHYGRTPPCVDEVIRAGIARCVVAMKDPNPRVAGRGIRRMREAGIEVVVGVKEKEARRLNEVFIKYITTGLPFVVLKSAVSLDGKIATRTGHSQWITGPEARRWAHRLRHLYDAVLVGIGTVLADNPRLTVRLEGEKAKDPVRVILDSRARIPLDANVLTVKSQAPTIIATSEKAPADKIGALRAAGAEVIFLEEEGGKIDLAALLRALGEREITSVLIEGGATVNADVLEKGLVDKVCWFIAPKFIGGKEAPSAIGGEGIQHMSQAWELEEVNWRLLGRDLYLEGYFRSPR